jgi:group I intron endonuclease
MNNPLRSGVIYTITCSENGKTYVGSTMRRPRQRWHEHLHHLRKGKHHSRYLQHAYSKHGEESLTFSIVENVGDANFLLPREQIHIWRVSGSCMNSAEVSDAVHAARAVNTGRVQSEEERSMRSVALLRAVASGTKKPRPWTPEQRLEHSIILTGRKMPPVKASTCTNISKAKKGCACPALAIEMSVAARTAFIADELPIWLEMRAKGLSYRDIERLTGRTRKMLSRECTRAENEARTPEAAEGSLLPP